MLDEFIRELYRNGIDNDVLGHMKNNPGNQEDLLRQLEHYTERSLHDILLDCLNGMGGIRILSNEILDYRTISTHSISRISIGIENRRLIEEIPRFLRKPKKLIRLEPIIDMDGIRRQLCDSNPEMDMILFRENYLVYRACVGKTEIKVNYESESKKYFTFDIAIIHGRRLD